MASVSLRRAVSAVRHHRQVLAEVVSSHQERAVVRAGDVFLKVDTDADRVGRELAALGSVVAVAVPTVLWQRPGNPSVVALSGLRGAPLAALGAPSPHSTAVWTAAGATLRRVHRQTIGPGPLSAPSRYRLGDLAELEGWLLAREVADRGHIAAHAARARAALQDAENDSFVHGDFQAAHVFVSHDGSISGVIDWGDAGVGDAHHDLAVLTVEHSENLDAVLEGCGADVDRDRISGYWSWRRLGSVRWMIEHRFDPAGDIAALGYGV